MNDGPASNIAKGDLSVHELYLVEVSSRITYIGVLRSDSTNARAQDIHLIEF